MFSYLWPIALAVLSNVVYHICAKSAPEGMNPLASLTVTYLIAAAASAFLYFALNRGGSLLREYGKLNWAPFALGIIIVGLEVGFLYAYKAGGFLLYREAITWNKLLGVAICLVGFAVINLK